MLTVRRAFAIAAAIILAGFALGSLTVSDAAVSTPQHYTVEAGESYRIIARKLGVSESALACANATGSNCPSVTATLATGRIIHVPPATSTTTVPAPTTSALPPTTTSQPPDTTTTTEPATTPPPTTQPPAGAAFVEDFGSATALTDRFDHGWSGEWNAGALFGADVNDWHGDHNMACDAPTTSRTIHLTSQQQANDAAFYPCTFVGDPAKSHLMTSVNTEGYVTVWFSPKQTFTNVTRVCWDQNITDEGGGRWTIVNFLTPAEFQGQTDLGYTSPDFPDNGGPSSPQGEALNGVKVFRGVMQSYTNGTFRGTVSGVTTSDKAARFQHCVLDNGNGTLTLTITQPGGSVVSATVPGAIPDGSVRVEFADDAYNPDKHFNDAGVATNSTDLYTWHWDNVVISAG